MQRDVAPFLADIGQGPRWKAALLYYTLAVLIVCGQLLKMVFSFLTGEISDNSVHLLPFLARFPLDPFSTNVRI